MRGGFKGPAAEAPTGSWVRYSARPGQVWHVRPESSKDGCRWTYGGSPSPDAYRQYHPIPGDTPVVEVKAPQAPAERARKK
jgi:hypothetical protein